MLVSKPQNLLGSFHLIYIIFVLVEYFAIFCVLTMILSRLSDALNIKTMFTWPVLCISLIEMMFYVEIMFLHGYNFFLHQDYFFYIEMMFLHWDDVLLRRCLPGPVLCRRCSRDFPLSYRQNDHRQSLQLSLEIWLGWLFFWLDNHNHHHQGDEYSGVLISL